jgi:hypothetical protein
VSRHDDAVPAPVGRGVVVMTSADVGDRVGEFAGELGTIGRAGEADLGVDREGRQGLAGA